MHEPLERQNLNDAVEAAVRSMIVDGRVAAGERLNEVHLAARLGVSRTPLREALNRLAAEGAIEARPRLGYFVRSLSVADFEQLYDIRPLLDPAALRLAGAPSPQTLAQLERLNERLARATDPVARIAIDDAWHLALIEACPNRVLIELVRNMMLRTKRYELAWMREDAGVTQASVSHGEIIKLLRSGELDATCEALRVHLSSAKPAITSWLRSREPKTNKGKS